MTRIPVLEITSTKNRRVRDAMRLRQSRHRKRTRKTLVDGLRECRRALSADVAVHELFVDRSRRTESGVPEITELARQRGAVVLLTEPAVMERLRFGERESPCLAVVSIPQRSLEQLQPRPDACVAIVEGIEKPGNLGAILRSADGAGIAAVVAADCRTELFQPNVIRASLGTVFTIPVCHAATSAVQQWLAATPFQVVAACVEGTSPYYDVDLSRPTAIVLGNEANGLSAGWKDRARLVRLPMHGIADSLNVSATAAVLFYEVLRQREMKDLG